MMPQYLAQPLYKDDSGAAILVIGAIFLVALLWPSLYEFVTALYYYLKLKLFR